MWPRIAEGQSEDVECLIFPSSGSQIHGSSPATLDSTRPEPCLESKDQTTRQLACCHCLRLSCEWLGCVNLVVGLVQLTMFLTAGPRLSARQSRLSFKNKNLRCSALGWLRRSSSSPYFNSDCPQSLVHRSLKNVAKSGKVCTRRVH